MKYGEIWTWSQSPLTGWQSLKFTLIYLRRIPLIGETVARLVVRDLIFWELKEENLTDSVVLMIVNADLDLYAYDKLTILKSYAETIEESKN